MSDKSYMTFDLEGWFDLDATLQEISDIATQKRIALSAMKKALVPVRDAAKRIVPVDEGDLRDSIIISTKITKRQAKADRGGNPKVYVGTNWPTAHLIEFGTGPRRVRATSKKVLAGGGEVFGTVVDVGRMSAQPFIRPSFEKNVKKMLEIYGSEMWKAIQRTAKRLRRQAESGKLSKSGARALGVG